MKYIKTLGLLAVAAAALMAFAGTASATITSPAGTSYGGEIVASSSNSELDGSVDVKCKASTVKGKPSSTGDTSGSITSLTFTECGADTVSVINMGTLRLEKQGGGWITVSSTGAEVTVQVHRSVFGFPVTTHCIYATSNTAVGTLSEGTNWHIALSGTNIPQKATDGGCGSNAQWTGTYSGTTPSSLFVD